MILRAWDQLPKNMQNEAVKPYYELLKKKQISLVFKRLFDVLVSFFMMLFLLPFILIIYFVVKFDTPGPVIFKQKRVTTYGKIFNIFKFRTMVKNAEKIGPAVTFGEDPRITSSGKWLRKYRLDELPQIFNIFLGQLSFVGTRPESIRYVGKYTDEMLATLLLPAGVTSLTTIAYKDEEKLLENAENADKTYLHTILPEKMKTNLQYLKDFDFFTDIRVMIKTILAVIK